MRERERERERESRVLVDNYERHKVTNVSKFKSGVLVDNYESHKVTNVSKFAKFAKKFEFQRFKNLKSTKLQ